MNKKFYLVVMTVLMSVSLFVIGCPTDAETDSGPVSNPNQVAPGVDLPAGTITVGSEAELKSALENDAYKYVALSSGNPVAFRSGAELVINKPLYLFGTVSAPYGNLRIESPVYVAPAATLDVKKGVTVDAKGSIYVFQGGTLSITDAESVSQGDAKTVLGTNQVKIFGTLDITANSADKIVAAVGFIEDGANLIVDAGSFLSPSEALSGIQPPAGANASIQSNAAFGIMAAKAEIGTTDKSLDITADGVEKAATLPIYKGVKITTSDALATVTNLTVDGELVATGATLAALTTLTASGTLRAPVATGDTTDGLTITVAANAVVNFGSNAANPIVAIKAGSTVAAGGSLTVGDVTTIAEITITGGAFEAGDVTTITTLKLEGDSPELVVGNVTSITNPITVPVGGKLNGAESLVEEKIADPATDIGPVVESGSDIGAAVFKVVGVGANYAELQFAKNGAWNSAPRRIGGITTAMLGVINAVYEPNKAGTVDAIDATEAGRTAIPFTTEISAAALNLFQFTTSSDGAITKVEITGETLPTATGASANNLIVIDIGKPGEDADNSALANVTFSIPNQGLGTSGGSYPHIRLRVNKGASLVILADNTDYITIAGTGHPCPNGYFNGGCVEVMAGAELRDGAYEGFPLGSNAVILNRYGSYLSVGPEADSADAKAKQSVYDQFYAGYLLGPQGTNGDMPRIVWDATEGSNKPSNYLEVRPGNIATNAKLTVQKSIGLIYSVFFIEDAHVTIDVAEANGWGSGQTAQRGLFSNENADVVSSDYRFYANTIEEVILVKSGSMLDKRYLLNGVKALEQTDIITDNSNNISIIGTNTASDDSALTEYVDASTGISGYLIPPPAAAAE